MAHVQIFRRYACDQKMLKWTLKMLNTIYIWNFFYSNWGLRINELKDFFQTIFQLYHRRCFLWTNFQSPHLAISSASSGCEFPDTMTMSEDPGLSIFMTDSSTSSEKKKSKTASAPRNYYRYFYYYRVIIFCTSEKCLLLERLCHFVVN